MCVWTAAGAFLLPDFLGSIYNSVYNVSQTVAFILAPFWEEVIYRWLPYTLALSQERLATAVAKLTNARLSIQNNFMTSAWIGSSILFGLAHGHYPLGVVYQGVYGLFFFLMMAKSRNLLWPIALHLSWNIFVMCMSLYAM